VQYWPGQVLYTSIVLVPLWAGGAVWAIRNARYRAVGIAAVAVIAAQFVLGGKTYYPGGVYTFLFAAGAAAFAQRPLRWRPALYIAAGAISALISLPLLPAAALARFPVQKINYDLGEEIGWPSQVALLARAYHSLPSSERAVATVITGNYGEAGALDRDTVAVAINVDPALLRREFAHVRVVGVYRNGLRVADDEEGAVVYVATGLRGSWASAWPAFRDYS